MKCKENFVIVDYLSGVKLSSGRGGGGGGGGGGGCQNIVRYFDLRVNLG